MSNAIVKEKNLVSTNNMNSQNTHQFVDRHIGPSESDTQEMLKALDVKSLEDLIDSCVPNSIRMKHQLSIKGFEDPQTEEEALALIRSYADKNKTYKSYLGMGYSDSYMPTVILRNVLENPGWYTQYTPYQPEISQGRLEALLNYQTVITDLTGLPVANASLLDEATAAAEAMSLSYLAASKKKKSELKKYFVAEDCHPQTIEVLRTRSEVLELEIVVGKLGDVALTDEYFGALIQYPGTYGDITDPTNFITECHQNKMLVTVAADILALVLLKSPAELGADIAVGSSQRFGVPLGYGGPHAAYFATKDEYKRNIPGRLVGLSKDSAGNPALRLALQTREQHIRREKATSNICTAQVLLAVLAGMYAVYHGAKGLRSIALSIHDKARRVADALADSGLTVKTDVYFDTVTVELSSEKQKEVIFKAHAEKINLREVSDTMISLSLDEATTEDDLQALLGVFGIENVAKKAKGDREILKDAFLRQDDILTNSVFKKYRSETEFLRYVRRLESKDLSLCTSMIPLGSCTMKLNATSEMLPVSWKEFSSIHPFVPVSQATGYKKLFEDLEKSLAEITGFDAVSLQPNAGSQGEYAGLLAIRAYHKAQGDSDRNVCLIPLSAHGTNPASAIMAGMKVVPIECDSDGNIDLDSLEKKAEEHKNKLSALMITYPSTHGVFEEKIIDICSIIHKNGGQVYLDGANLNALVGIAKPAELGADVCHMNLHKTFCIPHGGGGPGVGPIGVKKHLAPYLPGHSVISNGQGEGHAQGSNSVSAAPWGSSSILPISWMYIAMMGASGLKKASEVAILNANYIAKKLDDDFSVLYKGKNGRVAHECIVDLRPFKASANIEVVDIAKRLIDYGFHAPTVSWPVPGTMMIEPTESESKEELDRFIFAMKSIRNEIKEIENGNFSKDNNPLVNAPHTALAVVSDGWDMPYGRELAAFPTESQRQYKFWPAVARLDESYGDRNLVCSCPTVEELS